VLILVELVGDAITRAPGLVHTLLGHSFFAVWMAESVSNIALAALRDRRRAAHLDLIAAERRARTQSRRPSPAPASA
jgi:hypothetical protein